MFWCHDGSSHPDYADILTGDTFSSWRLHSWDFCRRPPWSPDRTHWRCRWEKAPALLSRWPHWRDCSLSCCCPEGGQKQGETFHSKRRKGVSVMTTIAEKGGFCVRRDVVVITIMCECHHRKLHWNVFFKSSPSYSFSSRVFRTKGRFFLCPCGEPIQVTVFASLK